MWCPPRASTDRCGRARGRPPGVEPPSARPVLRTVVRPSPRRRHPARSSLPGRRGCSDARARPPVAVHCPHVSGRVAPPSAGSSFPGPRAIGPATPTRSPRVRHVGVSRRLRLVAACGSGAVRRPRSCSGPGSCQEHPVVPNAGPGQLRAGSGWWLPCRSVRVPIRTWCRSFVPIRSGRPDRLPSAARLGRSSVRTTVCRGPAGRVHEGARRAVGRRAAARRQSLRGCATGLHAPAAAVRPARPRLLPPDPVVPFRSVPADPVRLGRTAPAAGSTDRGSTGNRQGVLPEKAGRGARALLSRPSAPRTPAGRAAGRCSGGTAGRCRPGSLPGRGAERRNGRCRVTLPDRTSAPPCGDLEWITCRIHEVSVCAVLSVRARSGSRSLSVSARSSSSAARPRPGSGPGGAVARSRTGHGSASG
ncbi:hypothetical protein SAMN05421870_11973 [Streptomyces qinglanensis]|uniref:Uncharacterized protein n=1 Tax=Streptomyces qinglanensis TaxID=943816 RepID=A0A1H9WPF6_9ACTN|nr:hypothetical protein SAMN05421870_11973 [Streptomyces qinglanensis]